VLLAEDNGHAKSSNATDDVRRDVRTARCIAEEFAELLLPTVGPEETGPYRHPRHMYDLRVLSFQMPIQQTWHFCTRVRTPAALIRHPQSTWRQVHEC
jgi:hypothetical protein